MSDKHTKQSDAQALATYLIGLALLQGNQKTHVNREIMDVIERLQTELKLNQ